MSAFKPGDVAMVRLANSSEERQMTRYDTGRERGWYFGGGLNREGKCHFADDVSGRGAHVRPLVVIDPEDPEQIKRLANAWNAQTHAVLDNQPKSLDEYRMRAALRSLLAAPKPEEPTGLGAVVEDDGGVAWVRLHSGGPAWINRYQRTSFYADINAVRILSDGVEVQP